MFGFVSPVLVVIVTVSVVQTPAEVGWVMLKVSKSNLTWQMSEKMEICKIDFYDSLVKPVSKLTARTTKSV